MAYGMLCLYMMEGTPTSMMVRRLAVQYSSWPFDRKICRPVPYTDSQVKGVYPKASKSRGLVSDLGVPEQVDALFLEVLVAGVLDRVPIAFEEVDQSRIPRPRTLPEDLLVTIRALHIENTFTESEACQDEVKEFFQGLTWLKGLLSDDLGACDQP